MSKPQLKLSEIVHWCSLAKVLHIILLCLGIVDAFLVRALSFSLGIVNIIRYTKFKQLIHLDSDSCHVIKMNNVLLAIGIICLVMASVYILMAPANLVDYFFRFRKVIKHSSTENRVSKVVRIMCATFDVISIVFVVTILAMIIALNVILSKTSCDKMSPIQYYRSLHNLTLQAYGQLGITLILQVIVGGCEVALFMWSHLCHRAKIDESMQE
jgi:hypothetical protein